MKKPNIEIGTRHDFKTGQYFPTLNGKDTSPSSFSEANALQTARKQADEAIEKTKLAALPKLLAALESALSLLEAANDHQRAAGRLEYDTNTVRAALLAAGYTE